MSRKEVIYCLFWPFMCTLEMRHLFKEDTHSAMYCSSRHLCRFS